MDRHDVRVGEAGRGFRFAQKSDADLLAKRELGRQDLDRHRALEPFVAGMVHDTHPAAPDLALEREGRPQSLTQSLRQRIAHADSQFMRG